mmetsp:Transcript_18485/g.28766  ORF Transcript_18485/g.28766 Transcript_18485/m.28766 type:complete len:164 (+) Transcript_18485:718-1209(+)
MVILLSKMQQLFLALRVDIIKIKKNSNKPPICLSQFDFHMIKHERSNSTEASNFEDLQEALHVFLGEKQLKPAPLATGWVFTKRNPVLKSGSCKAPSSSMINDATGWNEILNLNKNSQKENSCITLDIAIRCVSEENEISHDTAQDESRTFVPVNFYQTISLV